MSDPPVTVGGVGRVRVRSVYECAECGQQMPQWAGRCPGCGAWGSIAERTASVRPGGLSGGGAAPAVTPLSISERSDSRVPTGLAGVDRVLGGGLVPASVILLAGEPGIGKSTLLLQVAARLASTGLTCLYASGEESRDQVASRARRLQIEPERVGFVSGRQLPDVWDAARAERPFLLAVDSIQAMRDPESASLAGGPSQVRACADALVGLAKAEGITMVLTGHVTKEGDLAGPRTLEHAVDVVLSFGGDPRSGLRILASGKNRFGQEGEAAWFEMGPHGLSEVDPGRYLSPGGGAPGSATALLLAGRRALAVEIQALVLSGEGPPRRHATGIDVRRFSLVAAVLDQVAGVRMARSELYGASSAGLPVEDPACDLAIAAALASAARGVPTPERTAFVGEISLSGEVRASPGMPQRIAAARAAGIGAVYAPAGVAAQPGVAVTTVAHIRDALRWARPPPGRAAYPGSDGE